MSHASPEIRRVMRAQRYMKRALTELSRLHQPSQMSLANCNALEHALHRGAIDEANRKEEWRARHEEKKA